MNNCRNVYRYSGRKDTVDAVTGEIEKSVLVRQKKQDLNFVKIFLPEEGYSMFPKEMTLTTRDLFEYLCVIMDRQNVAIAPVSEIAERTNLSTASIARAKAQLFEFDFIRQRANNVFMINPEHAFKGDGDQRAAAYDVYESIKIKSTKEE